ncbi:hypothetical protein E4U13_007703 [Claviceps humidiphila]|uniref:Uncharacterized protein n=1 Tax=Claviceps humidiphila TaxID=1294629 RepID=A0A9P7PY33_9HYPO|nr:hypothetical protein E4U13_007703 [Claviceps humidiphila]
MDSAPARRWCSTCKKTQSIFNFPLRRSGRQDDPNAERILTCQPCTEMRRRRRLRLRLSGGGTPSSAVPEEAGREEANRQDAAGEETARHEATGEPAQEDNLRWCSTCRQTRPLADFPPRRGAHLALTCQPCKDARHRRQQQPRAEGEETVRRGCSTCRKTRPITDFPLKNGAREDDPNAERALTCRPCKDARHRRNQRLRVARQETLSRHATDAAETRKCSSCRKTRPLADFPLKRGTNPDNPNPERARTCRPCKVSRDRRSRERLQALASQVSRDRQRLRQLTSQDGARAAAERERAAAERASQVNEFPWDDDTIPFSQPSSPPRRLCSSCRTHRPATEFVNAREAKTSTNDSTKSGSHLSESEPKLPATNVFATTSQSYCVAFGECTEELQTAQKS